MFSKEKLLDGRYKVVKILGKGGMGTVYLCENVRLNKLWAIKEINKDYDDKLDLLSEPNILKNLDHPGIPKIVDIFYEEDNLYIVEDYIEGKTLKEYVRDGKISGEDNMCKIMDELCSIISYLHSLNPSIIYRDLKPSNIMISKDGSVTLVDFGIAKHYKLDSNDDTLKLGSNGYAAPEQYGSGKCCNRTDVYGAGMVLYFMSSGKNPSTPIEPLIDENYNDSVGSDIKRIIQKCVQIEIQDRYESIEELQEDIIKVLEKVSYEKTILLNNVDKSPRQKTKSPKVKKHFIGLMFLVAIALMALYFWNNYKEKGEEQNLLDKPAASDTTESQPKIEDSSGNSIDKQPAVVDDEPAKDNEMDQNDNTKSPHGKGKGKGIEKKKYKNKP